MDCPPKTVAVVKRWPFNRGGSAVIKKIRLNEP